MKSLKIFFICVISIFFIDICSSFPADTTNPLHSSVSYRKEIPVAVKIGVNGLGVEYTYAPLRLNVEVATLVIVQGVNVKYFYSDANSSPFVGLGIGKKIASFGGSGESNQWKIIIVGWQFNFKRVFFDVGYQYAFYQANIKSDFPALLNFGIGFRIF